ncbi:MAG: XdhC family protein, partial [Anaerolineales bacterium]
MAPGGPAHRHPDHAVESVEGTPPAWGDGIGRPGKGDLLERAAQLRERGTPFALATVVRVTRPSSARPGMKAVILADGALEGWVG